MSTPRGSVVVPAHDEGAVIERCLRPLRAGAGDLEVVVVANACTDDTAERARALGARVVETAVPGKANALNLGDEACTAFPRAYLDADVSVDGEDLRRVLDVLRVGPALAAAPRLRVDLSASSWPVRAYYRVWTALPYVTDDLVGSGFYALSRAGRARFGRFPDATGDDTFVRALFAPGERVSVPGTTFTVHPPRTLAALLAIKTRARFSVAEHAAAPGGAAGAGGAAPASALRRLAARPALWPAVPVYAGVGLLTRLRARRRLSSGAPVAWDRDTTSRTPA
ncbi:glycosyltransferase family 2 protein [Kineococcus indalonis]|uniref:glycosyltransferase family 2 protein n=1 Tax=Kineococcus indalonis TaxID=2696566 RepID=UPI00141200F7|nr:glycosyltransferase [Kineococcus indalonis]NAZ86846.1 glycosyltransferase [Kineococcus indalonis]